MVFGDVNLRVRRPSPTTVEFIVSDRPERHTVATHVTGAFVILGRVALAGLLMLLVLAKWRGHPPLLKQPWTTLAVQQPWWRVATVVLTASYLILRRRYREESLLVVRGLGIQTSSLPSTYLSRPTPRFIPTSMIQDILIHEAFSKIHVGFYMAVVVKGRDEVVVVFPELLPRRHILEKVWRGARACLYESNA